MIAHLKDEFDFYVLTKDTDYLESESYKNVKVNEWSVLGDGTKIYYFSEDRLNEICKIIDSVNFDFIYLNGIFSKYFTITPLKHLRGERRKKIIISTRGMLSPQALSLKRFKKKAFLFYAKLTGLYSDIKFHATSTQEIDQIKNIFGNNANTSLAPNLGRATTTLTPILIKKITGELRLINVARIAPEKNQLFALSVLKNIKTNVVYDLFGPIYNEQYWSECKRTIGELPENIKVNYYGALQENKITEKLGEYHFLFMPSVSENFGHIILESLTSGRPVIIGNNTPWKKLDEQKAGWNIALEKSDEFIKAVQKAAEMNNEEYSVWSESASELARKFNSNPEILQQNKNLFL